MYSRELDGKPLTLAPSGWTYGARRGRSTFVLYDKETGSLWFPFPGQKGLTGISGPHADRLLPELESTVTSWKNWQAEHPDTKYMNYRRGLFR